MDNLKLFIILIVLIIAFVFFAYASCQIFFSYKIDMVLIDNNLCKGTDRDDFKRNAYMIAGYWRTNFINLGVVLITTPFIFWWLYGLYKVVDNNVVEMGVIALMGVVFLFVLNFIFNVYNALAIMLCAFKLTLVKRKILYEFTGSFKEDLGKFYLHPKDLTE